LRHPVFVGHSNRHNLWPKREEEWIHASQQLTLDILPPRCGCGGVKEQAQSSTILDASSSTARKIWTLGREAKKWPRCVARNAGPSPRLRCAPANVFRLPTSAIPWQGSTAEIGHSWTPRSVARHSTFSEILFFHSRKAVRFRTEAAAGSAQGATRRLALLSASCRRPRAATDSSPTGSLGKSGNFFLLPSWHLTCTPTPGL
jgi:hypothetical protein